MMNTENNNQIQIIKHNLYLKHLSKFPHPESSGRLKAIYEKLSEIEEFIPISYIKPRFAFKDEIALIHDLSYIESIEKIEKFPARLDMDTAITKNSYDSALLAAGGLLEAVDTVITKTSNPTFALVRPPGHHAEKNRAKGFCLFNNIAIAARYAQKKHGIKKILICDWDVHHGNGTQNAFYDDSSILYFSTHQYPHFPGTGTTEEIGIDEGRGFTINCPLPPGQGDGDYSTIFQRLLMPIALSFNPDLVLVSAGFDAYRFDNLANMNLTKKGFAYMTSSIMQIASACCPGKIILALEGGYDYDGTAACFAQVIRTLSGKDKMFENERYSENINNETIIFIEQAKLIFSEYWQTLKEQ